MLTQYLTSCFGPDLVRQKEISDGIIRTACIPVSSRPVNTGIVFQLIKLITITVRQRRPFN